MHMRHIMTFLKVAQRKSFTGAAAELGYAQSTITGHIKSLESELGVGLLDRTTSQVRLTLAGERMIPYAERILDLAGEASLAVKDGQEGAGAVVIGSIESITTYRLPPLIEMFHHRYPELQLVVRPSACSDTQQALRQGEFDLGFLMAVETGHPGLSGLTLCEEEFVVVAAPDHPLVGMASVTTGQLCKAVILNTEYGCPYRDLFEAELNRHDTKLRLIEFGTVEAIKQMAVNGVGVTLLPRFAVGEELAGGELAEVAWQVPFTMYSQIAWNKNKWISGALQMVIDETGRVFSEAARVPERAGQAEDGAEQSGGGEHRVLVP